MTDEELEQMEELRQEHQSREWMRGDQDSEDAVHKLLGDYITGEFADSLYK